MDAGAVPWYAIFATSVCLGLAEPKAAVFFCDRQ